MPGYHPGRHPPIEAGSAKRPTRCLNSSSYQRGKIPRNMELLELSESSFLNPQSPFVGIAFTWKQRCGEAGFIFRIGVCSPMGALYHGGFRFEGSANRGSMSWNFAIFLIAGVATVSIVALLAYGAIRTFPSATPAKMAVLITAISGLVGAIAAVIYAFGGVPGPRQTWWHRSRRSRSTARERAPGERAWPLSVWAPRRARASRPRLLGGNPSSSGERTHWPQ